jgi:hypothetical protein
MLGFRKQFPTVGVSSNITYAPVYRPVTITSLLGEAGGGTGFTVSTTQSKFGGASAFSNGANKYLALSDIPLGSGDWTIEFWFWAQVTDSKRTLIDFRTSNGNDTQLKPTISITDSKVNYIVNGAIRAQSTYFNVTSQGWRHTAVVKHNGVVTVYFRGYYDTPATSQYTDSNDYGVGGAVIGGNRAQIGTQANLQDDWSGYIDEVRISNIARYTGQPASPGDYSPTTAFTNDANTLFLMHADGTNGSSTFTDDNT